MSLVEISAKEASDLLGGYRLDGRKKYARDPDAASGFVVWEKISWTDECSGCTEHGDYGGRYGPFGCNECGYTGKRRRVEWVPVTDYQPRSEATNESTT